MSYNITLPEVETELYLKFLNRACKLLPHTHTNKIYIKYMRSVEERLNTNTN